MPAMSGLLASVTRGREELFDGERCWKMTLVILLADGIERLWSYLEGRSGNNKKCRAGRARGKECGIRDPRGQPKIRASAGARWVEAELQVQLRCGIKRKEPGFAVVGHKTTDGRRRGHREVCRRRHGQGYH